MHVCHKCGAEWVSEKRRPGFHEACESCTAYLHCCKNCRFYEPGAHNDCRIGTTEFVGDKGRSNYCDEFEFANNNKLSDTSKKDSALEAFDELFGGKLKEQGKREAADFDKLFGD